MDDTITTDDLMDIFTEDTFSEDDLMDVFTEDTLSTDDIMGIFDFTPAPPPVDIDDLMEIINGSPPPAISVDRVSPEQPPIIKQDSPINTELAAPVLPTLPEVAVLEATKPMTVLGIGGKPVVVQNPIQFRNDIQDMVMAQMMSTCMGEKEYKKFLEKASVIEIATVKQLYKAAEGELDSFKYLMNRVLGRPVNQTNTVSTVMTYEQMLESMNPEERVKPVESLTIIEAG